MKRFILIVLLLNALPTLGETYFPLGTYGWTLQGADVGDSWNYYMSSPVLYHGAMCYPRVEVLPGGAGGTSMLA